MNTELDKIEVETCATRIFIRHEDGKEELLSVNDLKCRNESYMYFYLTLADIAYQVNKLFPNERLLIDVSYEESTQGFIYRYGNHGEYWEEHGTTKGFA